MDLESTDHATIEAALVTDKGTMVVTFFSEQAPQHVASFLKLAQDGFYNGISFHRIVRNFMIQTGCPNSKEGATGQPGTGGPGYNLPAEFSDIHHERGILSMARSQDPNSAGSQFFVVHGEAAFLDRSYTVFAKIEEGLDVLDAIASIECEFGPGGEKSAPQERVEIQSIELRPRQERAPQEEEASDGN
ncbi:MAG: peptidyl-prolyl cis-trans isomerase B (cyclophilin B) [Planctomycetota bacterium]|jgi:peptidyl-prolyl cis-trans isomerase B (cyclophilin B)